MGDPYKINQPAKLKSPPNKITFFEQTAILTVFTVISPTVHRTYEYGCLSWKWGHVLYTLKSISQSCPEKLGHLANTDAFPS